MHWDTAGTEVLKLDKYGPNITKEILLSELKHCTWQKQMISQMERQKRRGEMGLTKSEKEKGTKGTNVGTNVGTFYEKES